MVYGFACVIISIFNINGAVLGLLGINQERVDNGGLPILQTIKEVTTDI